MFTATLLRARLESEPFIPAGIATKDGRVVDARSRDLMMIREKWIHVGTPWRRNPAIAGEIASICIEWITDIRDLAPTEL